MARNGGSRRRAARSARSLGGLLAAAAVASVIFGTGVAIAAPSFEEQIKEINADARDARESGNLELVEQKRRERWLLIAEFAGKKDPPDSPWVHAYKAIEVVDGSEKSTEEDAGLLNALKYRESCAVLKTAFDEMVAAGDGPLLGEVATRLFEVAQQAKGVYRSALIKGSSDHVADVADIQKALEEAVKRDPCCVLAQAMLLYLEQPDPSEAFLRAEVRPSFKARQKQLVEISHPLILPSVQSQRSVRPGKKPGATQVNAQSNPRSAENEDVTVMPWHAAVELDKAISLQYLLNDLAYTKVLTPDFTLFQNNEPLYTIPGYTFSGTDAESSPVQLLYGQLLLARAPDSKGRRRSVAFYITDPTKNVKKQYLWDHRYIDVLWRVPSEEEMAKDPALRRKHDLLSVYASRKKWKINDQEFRIYDFPIRDTVRCLQERLQLLCVRNVDDLEKIKFISLKNDPDAVSNLQTPQERLAKTPFVGTTWPVQAAIDNFKAANDPTKHALIELMRVASRNPLVLVSERKGGSKPGDKDPNLIAGVAPGEPPYVLLDDGKKLRVSLAGHDESPCCWVEYDGATAYLPLTPKAVPQPIILGSEIGRAFVKVLTNAGYSEEQAVDEILRAMADGGDYLPEKFKRFMDARVKALRNTALKENATAVRDRSRLDPWEIRFWDLWDPVRLQTTSPAMLSRVVAQAMLEEAGWFGAPQLKPAINQMFSEFGFRYLRDRRGNWIMPRRLIDDDGRWSNERRGRDSQNAGAVGAAAAQGQATGLTNLEDYPYAYIAADGRRAIDLGQIYSWADYEQLKDSIYSEHLSKMLCFHPCLAAIEVIEAENRNVLKHPDQNNPSYMSGFVEMQLAGAQGGETKKPAAGRIPKLTSPFPAWIVEGDETQSQTLNNLYQAYMKRLIAACSESREMSEISELMQWVREMRPFVSGESRSRLNDIYGLLLQQYHRASREQNEEMQAMLDVQLESGRDYAKRKFFHKSLVWYNDLLGQLYPDEGISSKLLIFTEVPTTETASLFVDNLQDVILGQLLLINVQVEMAGVLNASGLKPSAHFVWQRMVDDYDFFLHPAVRVAEDLMESYGLRMSRRAQDAIKSLDSTVDICKEAIDKYGLKVEWRDLSAKAIKADGKNLVRRRAAAVRVDLARDSAGEIGDAERARLEREYEAMSSDRTIEFAEWLEWKKSLLELRPALAFRTAFFSPPWLACPVAYTAEDGFGYATQAAETLIGKADADEILAWCKKPLDAANNDALAGDAAAVIGWYWLDIGRLPSARAAFMNLARVKKANAQKLVGTEEGLVQELHAYAAITSAGAIVESMPGLSAYKSDFSVLLEGQLRDWEKRWFARGSYGPHASQQRFELMARAENIKAQLAKASRDWRSNRYFFPDYTFEYGAVPDYLAQLVYESPELFITLTDEQVKARGENAVEGSRWMLISEEHAEGFLKKRRLDGTIREEIVFLGE
jgi:hypothetical protein